jgi:hypothetical protein
LADARTFLDELGSSKYPPLTDIVEHRLRGEILLAEGNKTDGLKELEQASRLEGPAEHKEYLGRAYLMNGDVKLAIRTYEIIASDPGRVWYQADFFFPGAWSDTLFQYGQLLNLVGNPDGKSRLAAYYKLRRQADPDITEGGQAQGLPQ